MDTQAWMDQHDAAVATSIRRHRWHVFSIGDDCCVPGCTECEAGPPFAYTVGMFGLGHPELLLFSVDQATALHVFNRLGARILDGDQLLAGFEITVDGFPSRIVPETVPNPGEIVFEANRFYDRPPSFSVPVLQLSYTDPTGRFPWEPTYRGPDQPRPGTFQA